MGFLLKYAFASLKNLKKEHFSGCIHDNDMEIFSQLFAQFDGIRRRQIVLLDESFMIQKNPQINIAKYLFLSLRIGTEKINRDDFGTAFKIGYDGDFNGTIG